MIMRNPKEVTIRGVNLFNALESHFNWTKDARRGDRLVIGRADLSYIDFRDFDLVLSDAIMTDCDFSGSNLEDMFCIRGDFTNSLFTNACLVNACFRNSHLAYCDFSYAWATRVDFGKADLTSAEFYGAVLNNANFNGSILFRAGFTKSHLFGCGFSYANMGLDNNSAVFPETTIVPEGDIIGWKKCNRGVIVKLLIPSSARRSSGTGRKCRAEYAKVLEVFGADYGYTDAYGGRTEYRVGEMVYPDGWDTNKFNECSNGIHFFITRREAEEYVG